MQPGDAMRINSSQVGARQHISSLRGIVPGHSKVEKDACAEFAQGFDRKNSSLRARHIHVRSACSVRLGVLSQRINSLLRSCSGQSTGISSALRSKRGNCTPYSGSAERFSWKFTVMAESATQPMYGTRVSVSVYNEAGVSVKTLVQAERIASRVFQDLGEQSSHQR